MNSFVRDHPLLVYFVLAYALSWTMVALIPASFAFALLALFGPALAAVMVTMVTDGRRGLVDLFRRLTIGRVGLVWYVLAIGVPLLVAVVAQVVHAMTFGGPVGMAVSTPLPLVVILALLVIGEEIGWRGFALPHLQARYGGLTASLVLGSVWACWHLANATIPGLEAYWSAFPAFFFFVLGQTIFFTWLWNRTGGSLLLMWILHAMVNASISLFFVGDQAHEWWFAGAALAVVALIVTILGGPELARPDTATASGALRVTSGRPHVVA
jgi:uncharacterized protein